MATYTDKLVVLDSGIITKIAASDTIEIGGDFTVGGNLTVNGTTTTINSEVQTADDFILLNSEYTADTAKVGGIIWNIDPAATTFPVTTGAFSGANTVEVSVDPTSSLIAGDIILVQGAADPANNGLFEVALASGTGPYTITTESTVTTDLGLQSTFVTDSTAQGTVVKVSVTYLRAKSTGGLETATGDNAGSISFSDLATSAGSTLQSAYEAGETISVTSSEGDIAFTLTSADFVVNSGASGNFVVNGPGNANFGFTGTDLTTFGVGTGDFDVNASGNVTIDTNGGGISLDAAGASNFATSAGALTLTSAAAATWSTQVGALTLAGASGVNISGNAGQVDITTSGLVDINGNGVEIDATATMALTAITGMTLDSGGGAGLEINASNGAINIGNDAAAQAINIGTGGNRTITIGNSTLNTTLDLNGGSGGIDADTNGQINLDSSQAAATAIVLNASNAAGGIDVDAGTGGIDITSTGGIAISTPASSANALVIDDGTNTYLTLDSTDQQLELGQFLDTGANVGQGLTYANNSGAVIHVAKLVATDNATTLQVIEADGTGGSATNLTSRITGVAMEDIANAGSGKIHTAHGAHVNVSFTASVSTSNIGQVVYLDTTGDATLTAPSASGDFVVEVGILQGASSVDGNGNNVARVLFMPRFVAAL